MACADRAQEMQLYTQSTRNIAPDRERVELERLKRDREKERKYETERQAQRKKERKK